MGVLIHNPRATKTELRKGAVKPEIVRDPGNSQNVCGRRGDGRTEMGKTGRKEGEKKSQRKVWKTQPNRQRGKQHRNAKLSRRST